jgi:alpha-tubulin suppressor-like RCC1 family protein
LQKKIKKRIEKRIAMASICCPAVLLQDLPPEMLSHVSRHLGLCDLVRVSRTCKLFRHGGLQTVELPTESPVVTALQEHAFPRPELVPSTRPIGFSESWVAYLARCARQRRCREVPPIAAGTLCSLFVVATEQVLACGEGEPVGLGGRESYCTPSPVAAMIGVRVRGVAAGYNHSLALTWNGRVCSWGSNIAGQLGHGDRRDRPSPTLVEGIEGVRAIAATRARSLVVTQSGAVFRWGCALLPGAKGSDRPIVVDGFGGVRVRSVCAEEAKAFAIGDKGELFSWGGSEHWLLGHGDRQNQPSPKRVEALRGVRVSRVSVGVYHALALTADGLVYAWGENRQRALLGNPNVEGELLPNPVEALRGVRVTSVAATRERSYGLTDTGQLWAWGVDKANVPPLGHGEQSPCPVPKPIESLQSVKVDAAIASAHHTLALADDGSVYVCGHALVAELGALGLGPSVRDAGRAVPTPQRIPALRVACGL